VPELEVVQRAHQVQPLASPPVANGRIAHLRNRVTEATEWAMTSAWRPVVIGRAFYERDRDVGGGLLAGALAFRLFVWLAAFVVVLVAVLGFIDAAGGNAARLPVTKPPVVKGLLAYNAMMFLLLGTIVLLLWLTCSAA